MNHWYNNVDWNRSLSGLIAIIYIGGAAYSDGFGMAVRIGSVLMLPLACIWYSDELGEFTGFASYHKITSKSPGCLVRLAGWLILLGPLVLCVGIMLQQ